MLSIQIIVRALSFLSHVGIYIYGCIHASPIELGVPLPLAASLGWAYAAWYVCKSTVWAGDTHNWPHTVSRKTSRAWQSWQTVHVAAMCTSQHPNAAHSPQETAYHTLARGCTTWPYQGSSQARYESHSTLHPNAWDLLCIIHPSTPSLHKHTESATHFYITSPYSLLTHPFHNPTRIQSDA